MTNKSFIIRILLFDSHKTNQIEWMKGTSGYGSDLMLKPFAQSFEYIGYERK